MFRLAFAVSFVLLAWIHSRFSETIHLVSGQHQVFKYGMTAYVFFTLHVALIVFFALLAVRILKDRVMMWITLTLAPMLFVFVLPQLICERVELTATHLIHRREPPHTEYNCDIALAEIESVQQTKRETGSFGTYFAVGYEITMADGSVYKLPSCTVVTAAHNAIDAMLGANDIPVESRIIRRPPPD